MSGHNKWSKIKRKKAAADKEKSKLYSKHLNTISTAAKRDPNPETNPDLRKAIEQAEEENVPKDNIESALKRAKESAENTEEIQMGAYGPAGIAILMIAETDNKNRTIQEIKSILNDDSEGKWADPGSVLWAFEKQNETWQPKFPQDISEKDRKKLNSLVGKIEENEDIKEIYTSAS